MSFIDATRQNFTELPAQPYSSGGRVYFTLPKAGLLSKLLLTMNGTMTVTPGTGTAAVSERGAANIIKRIRLIANSGTSIFDVSGYGTYLINQLKRYAHTPDDTIKDRGTSSEVWAVGVNSGANAFKIGLEIPIAINERDPIGLILLQNEATQLVLEVTFNTETGANGMLAPIVVTGNATASLSANVGVNMEYFTVPRNKEDYPALNVIHQWLEQQDSITAAGTFTKPLLRGNTYMRVLHTLTLGNALNTSNIDRLRVLYNQSEIPYVINKQSQLMIQRDRYGSDLPKGTFVHDWYYSNGISGLGNSRDFINSAFVTEFQTELEINSGATVTAGQSFVGTITEQLIKIA